MRGQGSGPRFFSPVLSITHKKAKKKSCRNTRLLRIDNGTQKPMMLKNKVRKQELWPPARGRKSEGIHTAIETSLFPFDPDLLGSLDLVMADFGTVPLPQGYHMEPWFNSRNGSFYGLDNEPPDLVVRVTGFTAYFISLSPEFQQLVVDRFLTGL